jgi:hypothetical protein
MNIKMGEIKGEHIQYMKVKKWEEKEIQNSWRSKSVERIENSLMDK